MIRDLRPEERPLFLALCHQFYRSSAVSHPVPDEHFEKTADLALTGSPYVRVLLLLDGEIPAGFSVVTLTHSNEAGGLCVLIEDLMVLPEFRGKGLGRAFFRYLEAEYPHAARFRLEVMPDNEGAIRLYRRQGFVPLTYLQMVKEASEGEDRAPR